MELKELHLKLQKHLDSQTKNWDSFIYAKQKGYYQGFEQIQLSGCRNTEKRFEEYNINKYLAKNKIVLDIGSNCGFVDLFLSKFVNRLIGVEINPFLINIANDVKEFLEISNVQFVCSKFEDFKHTENFDIICSFANDSTIDGNTSFDFREYVMKIYNLLNPDGLVLFESQALDAFVPGSFNEKRLFLKKYFEILEEKKVRSEYPVNVPERIFLVLKKLHMS